MTKNFQPDKLISNNRMGFRDLHWCTTLNEPVIMLYYGTGSTACPRCPLCEMMAEDSEDAAFQMLHPFLFHIHRPDL